MAVKLGINGFGRVAKASLRASLDHPEVEVVAVNSVRDPKLLAHLLKYDSIYGILDGEVAAEGQAINVNGKKITVLAQRDPSLLNWKETGAEVVLEATGAFNRGAEAAKHLNGGAKKVIISAPGKEVELTVVMGVNEQDYDPSKHHVVSNASCTTNCLAVVAKVLHEQFGIRHALMTTVHSYTNDQRLLDITHNDFRRARAAAISMIPTTTGAARNVGLVLPQLQGKINGMSVRVPTATVSLVDLVAELEQDVSAEKVNEAFAEAARGTLQGILDITHEPLVSVDFSQNSASAVVDGESTMVVADKMVKVLAWYDNEWGYATRCLDLAAWIGKKGF